MTSRRAIFVGVTIAVVVKVNDGYVLASDSATTMRKIVITPGSPPQLVTNIYNNANKIFNLRKGLPISAMTWGQGNIDVASIATLAKDLRARFTRKFAGYEDWVLDTDAYTMADVATKFKEFFYDEHYEPYATANPGNVRATGAPGAWLQRGGRPTRGLLVRTHADRMQDQPRSSKTSPAHRGGGSPRRSHG